MGCLLTHRLMLPFELLSLPHPPPLDVPAPPLLHYTFLIFTTTLSDTAPPFFPSSPFPSTIPLRYSVGTLTPTPPSGPLRTFPPLAGMTSLRSGLMLRD